MQNDTDENLGIFARAVLEEERALDAERKRKEFDDRLLRTMQSEDGMAVLAACLEYADIDSSVTKLDPIAMAVKSGRRDVGLKIFARMRQVNAELAYEILEMTHD